MDQAPNVRHVERLHEERGAGGLEKLSLGPVEDVAGQEDDAVAEVWELAGELAIETRTVERRHLGVAQNEVVPSVTKHVQALGAVERHVDLVPTRREDFLEHVGDLHLVVDDQDTPGADERQRFRGWPGGLGGRALDQGQLDHERRPLAGLALDGDGAAVLLDEDRKSTRLNSSHLVISYAVFCLKKKKKDTLTN